MPLPPGLTLNRATGVISGIPTEAGTFTDTLRVRDSAGASRDIPISITIAPYDPPVLSGTMTAFAQRGTAYSSGFTRTDGVAAFTWTIDTGSLPTGLSINAGTGVVSGTPSSTTYQTYNFTVRVTDANGGTDTRAHSLAYVDTLALTGSMGAAVISTAYSSSLTRGGGHSPYTYAVTVGSLPPGLTLNTSTGVVSGTPTTLGTTNFTLRVTDAAGTQVSTATSITVAAAYTAISLSGSLTDTTNTYSSPDPDSFSPTNTLAASGGTGSYTYSWAYVSGSANIAVDSPTSLVTSFTTDVPISSTEATVFRLTVTDGTSSATYDATITGINNYVALTLPGTLTAKMTRSVAYSSTLTAANGTAPYAYSLAAGSLPTGITVNAGTGAVAGTPTGTSYINYSPTIRVTDTFGETADSAQSIQYRNLPILPTTIDKATRTVAFSESMAATNVADCHATLAYSVQSGTLPTGLSLNSSSGLISGTPTDTSYGNRAITIRATDGATNTFDQAIVLGYEDELVLSGTLDNAGKGVAYSDSLTRAGGHTPFTYTISVGTLPAGLSINASTGVISGTPSATGLTNFTVRVEDSAGNIDTHATSITVEEPVSVADHSYQTDGIDPATVQCYYEVNSDGDIHYSDLSAVDTVEAGEWLLHGVNSAYEVRATLNSGTLEGSSSATGSWLACSTTRRWTIEQIGNGAELAELLIEFRPAGGGATIDSATIDLAVNVTP